jgi:uncharacterized damage-inducible protein DinB
VKRAIGLMVLSMSAAAYGQVANPVVASAREIFDKQSKVMIAAAEEMPAEKYGYHPTPDQWTYGKTVAHVVAANDHVCAMLADVASPTVAVTDTSSKEALGAALKESFDFCGKALDGLKDTQMGDTITYFGGVKKPKARALVELVADLSDHYSQMASYLRLNGLLPPSAKPKK